MYRQIIRFESNPVGRYDFDYFDTDARDDRVDYRVRESGIVIDRADWDDRRARSKTTRQQRRSGAIT